MCLRLFIPTPPCERRNYSKNPAPLNWRTKDIYGRGLPEIKGIVVYSPNNWLRALLYKFGAPRRMIRSV